MVASMDCDSVVWKVVLKGLNMAAMKDWMVSMKIAQMGLQKESLMVELMVV